MQPNGIQIFFFAQYTFFSFFNCLNYQIQIKVFEFRYSHKIFLSFYFLPQRSFHIQKSNQVIMDWNPILNHDFMQNLQQNLDEIAEFYLPNRIAQFHLYSFLFQIIIKNKLLMKKRLEIVKLILVTNPNFNLFDRLFITLKNFSQAQLLS